MTETTPKTSAGEEALAWHARSTGQSLEATQSHPETGLSQEEAARRLERFGPNQLAEAPAVTFWQMLWEQFNNFVVILLIVAAVISAILGDYVESGAIFAIVVLNAALGVIQERRAAQELAALRQLAAPEANVLRAGHRLTIPARQLVPGDIVHLEAGNYIPADVRLLETVNLRIDEAALTGESVPTRKEAQQVLASGAALGDRKNMAFMGTVVTYGRGRGLVVNTGMQTQIGLIAEMLQAVEQEQTPLQRRLDQLGRTLGWAALAVCALVFVIGWLRGSDPLEMFIIAVSLAIAAVPEGLPAVVTISLALGMREMIKRNALIRRLSSVETLGSATVICSDKTGTLTQNQMTVTRVAADGEFISVTGSGYDPHGEFWRDGEQVDLKNYPAILTALWIAALNNDAVLEESETEHGHKTYRMVGDPTEGALIVAAVKAGAMPQPLNQAYPRVSEIPFDSQRKRMLTVHSVRQPDPEDISPFYDAEKRDWYVIAEKGAPDIVLQQCTHYQNRHDEAVPLNDEQRRRILAANDRLTEDALRVLGVAYRVVADLDANRDGEIDNHELEQELVFVGLIGMIDPARPEVTQALEMARTAGIRTLMITGDYPNTARAIATEIGLLQTGHQVLTGQELDTISDAQLQQEVTHTDVFARVSPEHKMRVVQALRANGQVVAMTGDGVNDAPSIKQADIGVAMGITGTDVTKETADMVLTDDNYASIVSAVEQGRIIYSNIRKFVYYLLSCNLAEIAIIFIATLAGLPVPLTAIQLLWLNLITDGAPALALGVEKGDPDIMLKKPRPPTEPIINRGMQVGILVQTVAITAVTLGAYLIGLHTHPESQQVAETMAFVTLSFSELLRAYTARSEYYPLLKLGIFTNKTMNWAVISSLLLLLGVVYLPFLQPIFDTAPLDWSQWQYVLPLLFVPSIAAEVNKWFLARLDLQPAR
ncbi:MAG: cation-translocating P-type ATPase [Anaerolineales bacterium]|nr:cation-translocating P-type ATPase [Anaerolineales bacterium]